MRNHVRTFTDDLLNAVEAADIGFARLDANECFEQTNPAFAAILGRKIEELVGRSWRRSVHLEDHARVEEACCCARSGLPSSVEIGGLRADGSILYQALTVTRLNRTDGELAGYHMLRHDISGCTSDQEAPNSLLMFEPRAVTLPCIRESPRRHAGQKTALE
jgi:PAS domain S-box-containing protein